MPSSNTCTFTAFRIAETSSIASVAVTSAFGANAGSGSSLASARAA